MRLFAQMARKPSGTRPYTVNDPNSLPQLSTRGCSNEVFGPGGAAGIGSIPKTYGKYGDEDALTVWNGWSGNDFLHHGQVSST